MPAATATKSKTTRTTKKVTKKKTPTKKQAPQSTPLPRPLVILLVGISVLALFQAPSLIKRGAYHMSQAVTAVKKQQPEAVQLYTLGPNELYISSLDIHAPLVFVNAKSEIVFQRALQDGIVHYPETANIGELGNAYFFGHSSDLLWAQGHFKTVFALLPEIQTDDIIIATDSNNHAYRYKAYETLIVNPDDTSVLDQFNNDDEILSLQTSYPVGTALQRFVVRARLVEGPSPIQYK